MTEGIRGVNIEKDDEETYKTVEIVFGAHYTVKIKDEEDYLSFKLFYTHHGFEGGAEGLGELFLSDGQGAEVEVSDDMPVELDKIIKRIREEFPRTKVDSIE